MLPYSTIDTGQKAVIFGAIKPQVIGDAKTDFTMSDQI